MKNIIALTVAGLGVIAMTATTYGQGQITFANSSSTAITYGTTSSLSGEKVFGSGGTYTYGLYLGPTTATSLSGLTLVDTVASPNAATSTAFTAGILSGGTITGQGNVVGSPAITAGTTYDIEVVGWLTSDGSYTSALNAGDYTGGTGLGTITPTASPAAAAQVFGPSGTGTFASGFALNLAPVPEPTTIALGGVGAAALLLFRRKK